MQDNTVIVDEASAPPALRFAPVFNVAVPFIDRHLDEDRADKRAIVTIDESVTYGELAERVNRCGNALAALGVSNDERVLMLVKDCPEFFYLFFGAIKSGAIPVPVNTMLRLADYAFLIDDSECAALVYSPKFAETVEAALSQANHKPANVFETAGTGGLPDLMARAGATLAPAPTAGDRRLLLALFLGIDRQSEGCRACPSRHGLHRRARQQADPRRRRGRRVLLGKQAVPLLWLRQRAHLSPLDWWHRGAERTAA